MIKTTHFVCRFVTVRRNPSAFRWAAARAFSGDRWPLMIVGGGGGRRGRVCRRRKQQKRPKRSSDDRLPTRSLFAFGPDRTECSPLARSPVGAAVTGRHTRRRPISNRKRARRRSRREGGRARALQRRPVFPLTVHYKRTNQQNRIPSQANLLHRVATELTPKTKKSVRTKHGKGELKIAP